MSEWLARFSIKNRLISLLMVLSLLTVCLTLAGLNGMRNSNTSLGQMYNDVLIPLDNLGDITTHMQLVRTQLLLTLQHRPGSAFEKAHDHPASMHFDAVDKSVSIMRERLADYQRMPMTEERNRLVNELQKKLSNYLDNGVLPTLSAMRQGDYTGGNAIFLTRLQPSFMTTYASLRNLVASEQSAANAGYKHAVQSFERLAMIIGLVLAVALFLAATLGMV